MSEPRQYCCDVHAPWRVGRKVGRTIYAQRGSGPDDGDPLIGTMDTKSLAAEAVESHNLRGSAGPRVVRTIEKRDGLRDGKSVKITDEPDPLRQAVESIVEAAQRGDWEGGEIPDPVAAAIAYARLVLQRPNPTDRGELGEALELLRVWVGNESPACSLDHHGYCQAHGTTDEGECSVRRARRLLGLEVADG